MSLEDGLIWNGLTVMVLESKRQEAERDLYQAVQDVDPLKDICNWDIEWWETLDQESCTGKLTLIARRKE